MNDFGFYWKNFARESKRGDWPCKAWYSNSDALTKKMAPGDRIWLFTSGEASGQPAGKAAYLVQVFFLKKVARNSDEDKEYPKNEYHYLLVADSEKLVKVDPPLDVDAVVRPAGHDVNEPIGRLMQSPRQLKPEQVEGLLTRLQQERAEAAAALANQA